MRGASGPGWPAGAARALILVGLLGGAFSMTGSSPSYMGVCQGYPDLRREFAGQIRSPSLQGMPYSSCSWVLLGGPEEIISIKFQRFHLICGSEVLTILSPSQPIKKFCGYSNPEPLRIKGGNVTLTYSWKFVAGDGFLLKYQKESKAEPCNLSLDDFYGVISPPAFAPGSPPGAGRCQWALDAHDSRPLSIRFTVVDLDAGDSVRVYEGVPGGPSGSRVLRNLDYTSNGKVVSVDSPSSRAWVVYQAAPGSARRGFNATYHVRGYCVPWDSPCGGGGGGGSDGEGASCYSAAERCDGVWDCASGADEDGCGGCPGGQFACGGGRGMGGAACYGPADRCNYQTFCADAADERHCRTCQPGNFRCRDGRCIYESWVCDGQADCADASDEAGCTYALPRKVVTAAVIGSLVCGLLLVIALGCTCRLYALRSHEFGVLAPVSRMEAQMVQRQAPPSYGQLIARGVIPPVDGFPTEHPNQNTILGNLRSLLHTLRREPAAAGPASGGRHPHRSRCLRRWVRRLRRWGLLPRPPPPSSAAATDAAAAASSPPVADTLPEQASGEESTASVQLEAQAPPLPQKVPPPPDPAPEPPGPPPPPTPRFSGMMQTLRGRLFPPAPPCSVRAGDTLGVAPSPEDEDDVLLVPLAEPRLENPAELWDDEPLLT